FDEPKYKKIFPYKHIFGFINNFFSDTIIAVSPAVKINLAETGTKARKITVVYNGVDPMIPLSVQERLVVREKYGLRDTDFVCGIVARLEPVKGHEYVLKAAQMLLLEDKDIKFLIVGTGSVESELKEYVGKNGLTNCIFVGFVKNVREVMGILDIQLNASYGTEATSISLLEGMSLGIPAVVSDFGGNPYVINGNVNGLLYEKKDYAEMCKAIKFLKESKKDENKKDYKHLSKRALEIFNEKFTSQSMTTGIENVYKGLVDVNTNSN
ncbi:MAG: glycosyltransferase family 4 protein, partial [Defluviitaleaceae bacterium]|nr:glycosyltransferase family 4 protein [Defluviitaleaceae bacterium]